ncbi:MAG: hypothetical protein NTZ80_00655 [Patescibacteria group bacterium]|nr:hypothetical protein [Patescibacteria group bacterium]
MLAWTGRFTHSRESVRVDPGAGFIKVERPAVGSEVASERSAQVIEKLTELGTPANQETADLLAALKLEEAHYSFILKIYNFNVALGNIRYAVQTGEIRPLKSWRFRTLPYSEFHGRVLKDAEELLASIGSEKAGKRSKTSVGGGE